MVTNSYVQVPPDSTGKKLHGLQHIVDTNTVEIPAYHLTDPNNPTNKQTVSYRGAANVAFSEGEPSLDAFGNLRVSTGTPLGYYDYVSDGQNDLFWDRTTGTGSITHVPNGSYVNLSVGSGATDSSTRSTTRYHFYQPGTGNYVVQTLILGDAGKTNNNRSWGYGDDEDALYWELTGEFDNIIMNHFFVVIRSNASGSVSERRIARKDWNGDKLDGNGKSGFQITLTGRMYYWIDFAWLGVGAARFGVLGSSGERIICHTFDNVAGDPLPYMSSGSLPLFWKNYNSGITSGASEMRSICSAVYSESTPNYNYWRFADIETVTPKTVTTNTPIISMRPALIYNTRPNRAGTYPDSISVYVTGGSIKLSIAEDVTLTGDTWGITGGGSTIGDISATSVVLDGANFKTYYLAAGCHNIDISNIYETNDEGYHVLGDGLSSQTFTLIATKLDGTTVTTGAVLNYRELR